jgi:hypothetical protein
MPLPCHSALIHTCHAVAMPCRAALIYTCHAVPLPCHAALLPFSDSAVSFMKVCLVAGNILTASPTVYRIGTLLITTFVEFRVVAGRSRTQAGYSHAVSGRPMLIHTCHAHAALCCGIEKSLSERHGHGMACVNQGRPQCVNQMRKTQTNPFMAGHGMDTA